MRYLLDTHILLWAISESALLPKFIIDHIENPNNDILISVATLWELEIKNSIGKIILPENMLEGLEENGFNILEITSNHVKALRELPLFHRDPFDRILIAQSQFENLTLISKDKIINQYNCNCLTF